MSRPQKHVFVCAQSRPPGHPRGSCGQSGAAPVFQAFLQQFEQGQLYGRYALTHSGCLGTCSEGPAVLIYPEGVLYARVSADDVAEIIAEHLLNDRPVTRLLAPEAVWG